MFLKLSKGTETRIVKESSLSGGKTPIKTDAVVYNISSLDYFYAEGNNLVLSSGDYRVEVTFRDPEEATEGTPAEVAVSAISKALEEGKNYLELLGDNVKEISFVR